MSARGRHRGAYRGAALVLAAGLAACGVPERPGVPPAHAFLITVDGLRADHVGIYGYGRPPTQCEPPDPLSIDGLAGDAVLFAHAFAPSAESRTALAALLSGANARAAGAQSLAEAFSAAGFLSAAFVTGAADAPELTRGFGVVGRGAGADPDYDAVRQAVEWLRASGQPADEPLFLWLHLSGPAAPFEPAPLGDLDFAKRFSDPDDPSEAGAGRPDGSSASLAALGAGTLELRGLDLARLIALYDAEIARVNQLVRQFALVLEGRYDLLPEDLLSQGVLVFAAARGAELFQHGRLAEDPSSLYDASLRVPLFLRHPASMTGRRVLRELVELRDVAPTLADWFDLELDLAGREDAGRSLLALTDSYVRRPFDARPVVLFGAEARASVRTQRWHLLAGPNGESLYDVQRDPMEQRDLAALEPERARELRRALDPAR